MANLLIKHQKYIESLRKEFYSSSLAETVKCKEECAKPKKEGLIFAFVEGAKKEMHVMDVPNNLKVIL